MKIYTFYTFIINFIILILIFNEGESQVLINADGGTPDNSAMLEIQSDSKGLLIPRMTSENRNLLASTAVDGLLVYDSDEQALYIFRNCVWIDLSSSAEIWSQNVSTVFLTNTTMNVGVGTTNPGGLLGFKDTNTYLDVDGSNNLTFTDVITGTKTLAELAVDNTGDFSDGGEAGGADRSLGNTDNYALSFLTNNTARFKIQNDGHIRIDGNIGLYADPLPEGGVSMNNIYLYDGGTYSGPYLKISGHNEARILLESRRVNTTSGNLWYLQSGGGSETYLDQFGIYNPDEGTFLSMRDGKRIGLLCSATELGSGSVYIKGNVGIYTKDPIGNFHVQGGITGSADSVFVVTSDGDVGIGTTSPTADLEVNGEIQSTYGFFHDRGDASSLDKENITAWTADGVWHDWDLSSIVPSGTKAVLIWGYIEDDAVGNYLLMRKNGNVYEYNIGHVQTQVANVSVMYEFIIPCDSNRIIEYRLTNTTWNNNVTAFIKGWWK